MGSSTLNVNLILVTSSLCPSMPLVQLQPFLLPLTLPQPPFLGSLLLVLNMLLCYHRDFLDCFRFHCLLLLLLLLLVLCFGDKAPLYNPGWHETYYIVQAGLELTAILLPQPWTTRMTSRSHRNQFGAAFQDYI